MNDNCLIPLGKYGAPEEIRTPDRSVRSRVLYPAELQAQVTVLKRARILLISTLFVNGEPKKP